MFPNHLDTPWNTIQGDPKKTLQKKVLYIIYIITCIVYNSKGLIKLLHFNCHLVERNCTLQLSCTKHYGIALVNGLTVVINIIISFIKLG